MIYNQINQKNKNKKKRRMHLHFIIYMAYVIIYLSFGIFVVWNGNTG